MDQIANKLEKFRLRLPKDRGRLLILVLITLVIPLTVALALYQQELRSRASGGVTPASPPGPADPTPLPPLEYKLNGITITNFQPVLSINPGTGKRLMTITSTGATDISIIGNGIAYGPGIYYSPSVFSIAPGRSIDVYMQVNSDVPNGNYSGTPIIRTDMGDGDIFTRSVYLYVGIPLPTPTNLPPAILRFNSVKLHGIGSGGDNTNPNLLGNVDPQRKGRTLTVEVTDGAGNTYVPESGNIVYDTVSRDFSGDITLNPDTIYDGYFIIKVKSPQYLKKQLPGIIAFKNNGIVQVASISLTTGDINNDNSLSLADYNILIDCYADLLPARNCSDANKKQSADLSDDGNVNQDDYNLFLRELSVVSGN